jgi:hypothetical protein
MSGSNNSVYYRIYLPPNKNKLVIVCLQWFDEGDYTQGKFYKYEEGIPMCWETEEEAKAFLNAKFKAEFIDEEYLLPDVDIFKNMEK